MSEAVALDLSLEERERADLKTLIDGALKEGSFPQTIDRYSPDQIREIRLSLAKTFENENSSELRGYIASLVRHHFRVLLYLRYIRSQNNKIHLELNAQLNAVHPVTIDELLGEEPVYKQSSLDKLIEMMNKSLDCLICNLFPSLKESQAKKDEI
jgi:hypothetical protein